MKKLLCALLALSLLCAVSAPALAVETVPEDAMTLSAPSALLMEKATGDVIYAKNAHERQPPASVTKVMTMLLIAEAVDGGVLRLEDMITASAKAASMGGSQIWLEEGEQLSVSEMLKCIAVVSANDCAVAMAEAIAGSEEAFVQRMNARAAELGLEDTNFKNCTGLFDDPEHYTSAWDVAVMSRELIVSHPWIRDYTTIWMDTVRGGKFALSNTNKLVYYYDGCTGLKTGYTPSAMYCLSATAERDGVEFIAVIMHGESIEKRNEDAKALLSYGFANYTLCSLRAGDALPEVAVDLGAAETVQAVYDGADALLLKKGDAVDISYALDLAERVSAPVRAGDALGKLTVYSAGTAIAEVPVTAAADVARLGSWGIFVRLLRLCVCSA